MTAGVGTAIALPFLEAMDGRKAFSQARPKRFLPYLKPNGMSAFRRTQNDNWTPRQLGQNWQWTPLWQGFQTRNLQKDITVLSCVDNKISGGLAHDAQTTILAPYNPISVGSKQYETSGGGRSVDQFIMDKVAGNTRVKSAHIGVYTSHNFFAPLCVYWSYTAPRTHNPIVDRAHLLWDLFFKDGGTGLDQAAIERLQRQRRSMLDGITANANSLKARLGKSDASKLDGHLEALRSIETRITQIGATTGCMVPKRPGLLAETPTNIVNIAKLQTDILVTALSCDLTRVATYMFGGGQNDGAYPFLGLGVEVYVDTHHAITHDVGKIADCNKIDTWQMDQIAYLIDSLKKTDDGGTSLLDNTVVMITSDSTAGGPHNTSGWYWNGQTGSGAKDHAFILAGGTHYFKHGSHIRYKGGAVAHQQILRSCYEAVTGIEGPESGAWMPDQYRTAICPGLRGEPKTPEML